VKLRILLLTLIILTVAAPVALAANPHFIFAKATINNSGALVVNWKEAGLGDNQNVTYNLVADAAGTWGCVNKGGNHPQASNKEDFSETLDATVTLSSGKNGNITSWLSVMPTEPANPCPSKNMVWVLMNVTYTNISFCDSTNGICPAMPASLSAVLWE
jgi:hypothetical protein